MQEELYPAKPHLKDSTKKKIIICCDGTGNEFGDSNSNVVRLYTALLIDDAQVGYYHPGVGTMGDPAISGRVARWFSKVRGLAFGYGFKDNVLDAYRYLMNTYNDGDAVYFFGFSRGAYTARTLAGLLDGYGLLCKGNEGHLPYAWRLYLDQLKNRNRHEIDHGQASAQAFKETFSHEGFRIHFVGLWDTVSAVGWVSAPLRLFNVAQNPTLNHARHAVSIDERRCFYQDNLYGEPLPKQTIQQVWFPGVHSDVGGSYSQISSGLSNITLKWMIEEAEQAGLGFSPERKKMLLGEPWHKYPKTSEFFRPPAAKIVHHSLKGLWKLLEILPHRYYDKDDAVEQMRIPLGAWRTIPPGSLIHSTVHERLLDKDADYRPKNVCVDDLQPVLTSGAAGSSSLYTYEPRRNNEENQFKRISLLMIMWIVIILVGLGVAVLLISVLVHAPAAWRSMTSHPHPHLLKVREAWQHIDPLRDRSSRPSKA